MPSVLSLHLLTSSAPTTDQIERAKLLAEDLLAVLRVEYEKARAGGGHQGGVYPQGGYGYGAQGQAGADPYAGYYVSGVPFTSGMNSLKITAN